MTDNISREELAFKAQMLAAELQPLIHSLPHGRHLRQINMSEDEIVYIGRETYSTNGEIHNLYPIIYNPNKKEFGILLDDTAFPLGVLLTSDVDIPGKGVMTVGSLGLYNIFSHLGLRAKTLIQEGILSSKVKPDDYVFLYLSVGFFDTEKTIFEHNQINKYVVSWLNTGLPVEKIVFFIKLNKPEYTPETVKNYADMPLSEII